MSTYVNDAIRYRMACEQILYYSDNCFGHADTIGFDRKILRIHDLKTGMTASSMDQLEVYTAIFCLEYGIDPFAIRIELRIYQRGDIRIHVPSPERITSIMQTIIEFDRHIEAIKESLP